MIIGRQALSWPSGPVVKLTLNNRAGWDLKYREKITRVHGVKFAQGSQYYSILTYDPVKRVEESGERQGNN